MNAPRKEPVNMTTNRTGKLNVGLFDQNRQNGNRTAQEANVAMPSGEVDSLPVQEQQGSQQTLREDFPDVFAQQTELINNSRSAAASMMNKKDKGEESVEQLNKAMGGTNNNGGIDEEVLKISKEDLALCEQIIFKGYAETDVSMKNFADKKLTICSTNASEIDLIDEIVFEKIRSAVQNPDGSCELPENSIRSLRNALFLSVSYRGINSVDLSNDSLCHLNTIKRAIIKLGDIQNEGNMPKAEELKKSIKQAMLKRANLIKRFPTTLLDWITNSKYEFDTKVLKIMNSPNIVSL